MTTSQVYVLVDWKEKHIIGVYEKREEARSDYERFITDLNLHVVTRDLIK